MERAFGLLFSLQRGTPGHGRWVLECLKGSWCSIVGDRLAAVCIPVRMNGSILRVEVVDEAWADTLKSVRGEMRDRIHSATRGEIKEIFFVYRNQYEKES
jgi:hypothetical protein